MQQKSNYSTGTLDTGSYGGIRHDSYRASFSFTRSRGRWEFRLFGWGIRYKHTRIHPPHFSECLGLVRNLEIGPYWFKILKP
jgi:hypothetical protein